MKATYKGHPVTVTKKTSGRIYFILNGALFFVPKKSKLVVNVK